MAKNGVPSDQAGMPIPAFDPPRKPKRNKYALACALMASLASILLGYDIGVMSGAIIYIVKDITMTDVEKEVVMGIINLISLVGSFMAGRTSDWIGRRFTIIIAGSIFFVGALLMGFATNYAFLMVGRIVAGIGVGFGMMIAPVYTAEVAPASVRGFLTSFPEVFINVGILLGYVSNVTFANLPRNLGWRFMFGIGIIPAIGIVVGALIMPESPRWLVMQGRISEAKRVLDKTSDSPEESFLRLHDIKQAAGIPENCNDDNVVVPASRAHHGEGVWRDLLCPTPVVLHIVMCAFGINIFQQVSGIDSVVLYSPTIFEKAGIKGERDKLLATVSVGFTKTVFILVATFLVDKFGRRPLLLTSMGGMFLSLMALATGLTVIDNGPGTAGWAVALCVVGVLSYVAFFSCGMGPVVWVYCSEIFPLKLRAQGVSTGVALNRVMSGTIGITFISLYKSLTIGGAFFLYGGLAALAWVYIYVLLPETRGRSLEETEALFGGFYKWRSTVKELDEKKKEKKLEKGDNN
ncbi:Putative polyol transporter 1 [Striga hermonthica]|uniref:Polyol transporter 1 n=1 Tax=Striga hermonthica TaxID=68872 RepID=A0A9N7NCS5_STRHE|nr:Putative polyol transporter 1 [Striga hermonthica]